MPETLLWLALLLPLMQTHAHLAPSHPGAYVLLPRSPSSVPGLAPSKAEAGGPPEMVFRPEPLRSTQDDALSVPGEAFRWREAEGPPSCLFQLLEGRKVFFIYIYIYLFEREGGRGRGREKLKQPPC